MKPFPGSAAAFVDRTGGGGESSGDDPGRGDLEYRYENGGYRSGGYGFPDEGTYGLCDRSPAVYRVECGRDYGSRVGTDHRTRDAYEAYLREGQVSSAVYGRIRAGIILFLEKVYGLFLFVRFMMF